MKTLKFVAGSIGLFAVANLPVSISLADSHSIDALTYAPLEVHSVPALSVSMLAILGLLLMVVTFRVTKNKSPGKWLVSFIGVLALSLSMGGFKIATDVIAAMAVLDRPEGGTAAILELQINDYTNTSGVPLQITDIDISSFSCTLYQGGSGPGECALNQILNNSESCRIDCSPPPLPPGVIQFANPTYTALEIDGSVTVELIRTGGSAGTIEVQVSSLDGSAASGLDYDGLAAPLSLSWPDGDTSPRTVTFPILTDAATEPDETFTVQLSATDPGLLGSPTTTEVTIIDVPTSGLIQFASPAYTVSEADGSVTVEIVRIGGSVGAIDIQVFTVDGTAEIGLDYAGIPAPLTLTFADGSTTPKSVTLPISSDAIPEPDETFTVELTAVTPGVLGSVTSTEVTITDVPPGVIQFASPTYTVSEADGSVTVEITRTGGSSGAIEIQVFTVDGTAEVGLDYAGIPAPLTLTFADGSTAPKTVTLPILSDAIPELDETFTVELTAATPGVLGSVSSTEVTITDVPPGVIQFASPTYTVSEADGSVTVEITRTGGSSGTIEVQVFTLDGTAEVGLDYAGIPAPLTLTFADGSTTSKAVTLPIASDTLTEPDETFTVELSAMTPGVLGSVTSTEVTITDSPP